MHFHHLTLLIFSTLTLAQVDTDYLTDSWQIHNVTLHYDAARLQYSERIIVNFAHETSLRMYVTPPQRTVVYLCTYTGSKTSKPLPTTWQWCGSTSDQSNVYCYPPI